MRFRLVDGAKFGRLYIHTGLFNSKKKYTDEAMNSHSRYNILLSYKRKNDEYLFPSLSTTIMYQPRTSESADYQTRVQTKLKFALSKAFWLSFKVVYDYNSRAPEGTYQTDVTEQMQFEYDF